MPTDEEIAAQAAQDALNLEEEAQAQAEAEAEQAEADRLAAEAVEEADVEKLKEQNIKLFKRAKKAEGFVEQSDGTWIKKPKPEVVEQPPANPQSTNTDTLSRDEAILIASGMGADDLDELKDVAKAKGIPLLKAKETPLFQAYLEKKEADSKKEKAKLGTSKGSQVQQEQKIGDLPREEHEALSREMMSKVR